MTPSQIPPPDVQTYSVEREGMAWTVRVRCGGVDYSELPQVRRKTWIEAREILRMGGYLVRRLSAQEIALRNREG